MSTRDDQSLAEHAAELLANLRAVPPVGSWAVLDSEVSEGFWMSCGTRPTEWHHTRAQAEASARQRPVPTWIAKIVKVPGGWSTGEEFFVGTDEEFEAAVGWGVVGSLIPLAEVTHGS